MKNVFFTIALIKIGEVAIYFMRFISPVQQVRQHTWHLVFS